MKNLFKTILVSLSLSTAVSAAPTFNTGSFTSYNTINHQPTGCDILTNIVLDRGELLGELVYITNGLDGLCEIYVPANPRTLLVNEVEDIRCGSVKYHAETRTIEGKISVEITDHRSRACKDIQPYLLKMDYFLNGELMSTTYSQEQNQR